jgi:hypothetical protein
MPSRRIMTFKYPQIFQQYLLYYMQLIRSFIFTYDFHVHSRDQQGLMVNGFHCGEERKEDPPLVFALNNHRAISSPET